MYKLSGILKSTHYVILQLSYPSGQSKGALTAKAAKKTLLDELTELEKNIGNLDSSINVVPIELEIKYLKICLSEIDEECDYKERPLNYILAEYFDFKRDKLKRLLEELEKDL